MLWPPWMSEAMRIQLCPALMDWIVFLVLFAVLYSAGRARPDGQPVRLARGDHDGDLHGHQSPGGDDPDAPQRAEAAAAEHRADDRAGSRVSGAGGFRPCRWSVWACSGWAWRPSSTPFRRSCGARPCPGTGFDGGALHAGVECRFEPRVPVVRRRVPDGDHRPWEEWTWWSGSGSC